MAGHSKWANIKRRKGAQDAARGKRFTKLIKEVMVASKMGGSDPDANARLRLAIDKCKQNSVPKDTVARAVAKGAGELQGDDYQEVMMEGYGPGGVALLVEVLTDNRNRAAADIRHAFNKGNGNLGTSGCVAYMFARKGVITFPSEGQDEDEVMMAALDAGAEDVSEAAGSYEVVTEPGDFESVRNTLAEAGFEAETADVTFVPDNTVTLSGDTVDQFLRLVDLLDDCDDVQNVHHNADISDEDVARLSG